MRRIWIAFICTVGLIWCAAATLPGKPPIAAFVFLPAVVLVAGNALQHIFWSFYFRQYAPGVITAVLLIIPLGGYLTITAIQQHYVPLWYVAAWLGVMAVVVVQTVRSGNRASPMIHRIYNLGNWIAEKLSI
ncbi:MAG: HXXEE domain-containing protein [Anaerolineae bacterium]|nr:HXXEE domain-containing protein [Anaerolineae bacterium]